MDYRDNRMAEYEKMLDDVVADEATLGQSLRKRKKAPHRNEICKAGRKHCCCFRLLCAQCKLHNPGGTSLL